MKKLKLGGARRQPEAEPVKEPTPAATLQTADAPASRRRGRTRRPRVKLAPVRSAWRIFLDALGSYRRHWKGYIKILAVVTVPTSLLGFFTLGTGDAIASSYVQFASMVMNIAFLYTITQAEATGRVPGIREAYYDGSASIVRFLLACFALVVMIIPLSFGAALYVIAINTASYFNTTGVEQLLVGGAALLLAIPSLFLLVRYAMAPLVVVRENLRPLEALQRARIVTIGRFWGVAGRMLLLFPFLLVVSIPSLLVFLIFGYVPFGNIAAVTFQIAATFTVLPIGTLYFMRLFSVLEESFRPAAVEKAEGITDLERHLLT